MDYKLLTVLLAAAVLLAGCAGGAANAGAQPSGGGAGAGASGGAGGADAGAGAGAGAQAGSGAGAEAQALGFMALQALGAPTQCTVKMAGQPDAVLYVKGNSVRVETKVEQEGQSYAVTSIIKNDAFYVDTKYMGNATQGCDWFEFKVNTSAADSGASQQPSSGISEKELADLPASDFSCTPAVFGDEKFATPGKVCNLADLMAQALKDSGASAQTELTDEEKQQLAETCASITDAQTRQILGCP